MCMHTWPCDACSCTHSSTVHGWGSPKYSRALSSPPVPAMTSTTGARAAAETVQAMACVELRGWPFLSSLSRRSYCSAGG